MEQFESFIGVNFWTALLTLLNTLTIYFVGKKYLFGPVMDMIHRRQAEIDTLYADANAAKDSALALEADYRQKLTAAGAESERLVQEAVARGQRREEALIQQARAEADALRAKASADIAMEKKQALQDAKDQLSDLAVDIATRVLDRQLTQEDQSRLVDAFIAELGDGV